MNEELYNFVYGIEERETPNLDQVDERYFKLMRVIQLVYLIVLMSIITILCFYLILIERITGLELVIYEIFWFCISLLITVFLSVFFRYDKIIFSYMVKKNPKAYIEYQNLLPDYYYIMGWVKLKEEVRK